MQINYEEARQLMLSIQKTNGASYNPTIQKLNPLSGYMVAVPGYEKIVPRVWNTLDLLQVVNDWLAQYARIYVDKHIAGIAGIYIGLWEHENKLYMDLSQRIISKQSAINLAIRRNQLAIYDLYNSCDIVTGTKPQPAVECVDADIITDKLY